MRTTLLIAILLAGLTPASQAAEPMPALQTLQAADMPGSCGCVYGEKGEDALIYWSWADNKQFAFIREPDGLRKLTLRSEKYFPSQNEPPRPGERMTLQLSYGNWSIQTVNEVLRSCSPKAKSCKGTDYRSRIILQWSGRQREELQGWGRCSCQS